jgi:PQQ-dependent dehydrogenase (methanol/ethanol family)
MEEAMIRNVRFAATLVAAALAAGAGVALAQAGREWTTYGGDSAQTRHSTLAQINATNVHKLKVAWVMQLGTLEAQESTPLVVGDTMYVTSSHGPRYVYALDARSGGIRWKYEPEIPGDYQQFACCGVVNRGAAYANGRVFVTRLDGHLVALDAKTGKELWDVKVVDYTQGSAITSPPTVAKDLVVTGFAGGEYGIRGAITAYRQATGELVWRTYTVPEPGEPGSETWKDDSWKRGGGSVWLPASYDPKLNLLYIGTSNPGPWGASVRGPDSSDYGQYTNLYTASTLALDADTGRIAWYYQTTPYDAWDYDGVNEAVLTDVTVGGRKVAAALKADRNGFFYVLDRATGKLVSAEPFVHVNWAKGIDKATGRPIENPAMRPKLNQWARGICPNLFGGKNWEPMSYSPQTGLVYIPTFNLCMDMAGKTEEYQRGRFYLASEFDLGKEGPGGFLSELVAWDPVRQKKVWGIKEELPYMGGALSTAGGVVFYGNINGWFKAVDAKTGKELWKFNCGSGISQGAIAYQVDGRQYIAVVSGRLKTPPSFLGPIGERVFAASPEGGAVFVFELGT